MNKKTSWTSCCSLLVLARVLSYSALTGCSLLHKGQQNSCTDINLWERISSKTATVCSIGDYMISIRCVVAWWETDELYCIWTALSGHNMTCFFSPSLKAPFSMWDIKGSESFIWKASIWFSLERWGDVLKSEGGGTLQCHGKPELFNTALSNKKNRGGEGLVSHMWSYHKAHNT